jgi:hypothetical protein
MTETPAGPAGPLAVRGLTPPSERTGAKRRIGDVIVMLGFADRRRVESVADEGRARGLPLGQSLIEGGIVDSTQLAHALAECNGLAFVDLNQFEVDKGAAQLIDAVKARRYQTIPIAYLGESTLLVATADPANVLAFDDITMATGYEVSRAVASPEDIVALIGQLSRLDEAVEEEADKEPASTARSSSCATWRKTRRWSGSSIRSSPTPSAAAPPPSISSRARRTCASAFASTAWSTTRRRSRPRTRPASCRA